MENISEFNTVRRVRSVFISDVHLGFPGCSAEHLARFLRSVRCDYLYLVGDIIDFWYLKKRRYWSQAHNNVVRSILGKAKHDTQVIFIPGNHDEVLRQYDGVHLGNVKILKEVVHKAKDGRQFLVLHGDQFDYVVRNSRFLAVLGSRMYDWLLWANRFVNWWREKTGRDYWSLAKFLKHKVKNAVSYIGNFELAVAKEGRRRGVDGLICGHIHHAEISTQHNMLYLNCGDWVESCTALVELENGRIELIHFADKQQTLRVLDPGSTEPFTPTFADANAETEPLHEDVAA